MANFRNFLKFRASLGPVEQAQIVASTAVVVTLVTIVVVRITSGHTLELLLFGSVLAVGVFGFIIVFFTLRYGRLLEAQKQELLALNSFAESVNRAIGVQFLLHNALSEMKRLLEVEYGWIFNVENNQLVLKALRGTEELNVSVVDTSLGIHHEKMNWIHSPRIVKRPKKSDSRKDSPWAYGVIESLTSVPIMMKDQLCGLIVLASRNREAFSNKQIALIMAFANEIGIAMENAMLFERVRKSEERYIDLFENSPDMSHIFNKDGIIISCNQTEATRLGYNKEELVGKSILKLYPPEYHKEAQRNIFDIFDRNKEIKGIEEKFTSKNEELIDVSINASIILDENGQPLVRAVARDITEQKKFEAKIIHAQRIDSIGNLAGGIAHDFNNILTSILGSTSIMKRKMKQDDRWYRFADIIETAARRGASLTRQLLTFARKSNVQFRPIVVNDIIEETLRLFERSTDKTILVEKKLTDEVCIIHGDDGQLQQAFLNLLINARDAMPDGGTITIHSKRKSIEEDTTATPEIRKGLYVAVSITDTGVGMDKKTQQHIFEPFFTTKDIGKGTGLGLSVVYGVVNSHNGFVTVQSELGHGAEFTMYFPIIPAAENFQQYVRPSKIENGTERVLVIDDEKDVADIISGMLDSLGYQVTHVDSGQKAINLYKKKKRFDVVVLDLNMPKMSGKETFIKLKKIDPNIRVVISTGYGDRVIDASLGKAAGDTFLQKPYQIEELSKIMRLTLNRDREKTSR
ncbi:MAG: PAS domain S-box protein [Ignavibacteriales bacterium]|nr:PAS domain S-box protein [Ignavibacteriales bacterium]